MMNVKSFLIAIFSISCSLASFGQSNLLNAKSPSQIGVKSAGQLKSDNDKPLAYGYVHDRDILMSRTTWEVIDLGEKINFPLYFPIDTANIGPERRSLYDVLIKGIKKGKITEVYSDSYFNTKKSFKDIKASLSRIDTTDAGREQLNAGQKISPEYIVQQDLTSQDVTQYKIKGLWYFDGLQWRTEVPGNQAGELKYWNGESWVLVPPGQNGQTLTFCNGIPQWGPCQDQINQVTTNAITALTDTSLSINISVNVFPISLITESGVCYGKVINPTISSCP